MECNVMIYLSSFYCRSNYECRQLFKVGIHFSCSVLYNAYNALQHSQGESCFYYLCILANLKKITSCYSVIPGKMYFLLMIQQAILVLFFFFITYFITFC